MSHCRVSTSRFVESRRQKSYYLILLYKLWEGQGTCLSEKLQYSLWPNLMYILMGGRCAICRGLSGTANVKALRCQAAHVPGAWRDVQIPVRVYIHVQVYKREETHRSTDDWSVKSSRYLVYKMTRPPICGIVLFCMLYGRMRTAVQLDVHFHDHSVAPMLWTRNYFRQRTSSLQTVLNCRDLRVLEVNSNAPRTNLRLLKEKVHIWLLVYYTSTVLLLIQLITRHFGLYDQCHYRDIKGCNLYRVFPNSRM